jgi:hypothetical protein
MQAATRVIACILGMSNIVYAKAAVDGKSNQYHGALVSSHSLKIPEPHYILAALLGATYNRHAVIHSDNQIEAALQLLPSTCSPAMSEHGICDRSWLPNNYWCLYVEIYNALQMVSEIRIAARRRRRALRTNVRCCPRIVFSWGDRVEMPWNRRQVIWIAISRSIVVIRVFLVIFDLVSSLFLSFQSFVPSSRSNFFLRLSPSLRLASSLSRPFLSACLRSWVLRLLRCQLLR